MEIQKIIDNVEKEDKNRMTSEDFRRWFYPNHTAPGDKAKLSHSSFYSPGAKMIFEIKSKNAEDILEELKNE